MLAEVSPKVTHDRIPLAHRNTEGQVHDRSPTQADDPHHLRINEAPQTLKKKSRQAKANEINNMEKLLIELSANFSDSQKFLEGADLGLRFLQAKRGDTFLEISDSTIAEFKDRLVDDAKRRELLNMDSEFRVTKDELTGKNRITRVRKEEGQRMLQNNLDFFLASEPEFNRNFKSFEEVPIKYGAFTVLTLLEMDTATRISELKVQYPTNESEPVELHPGNEQYLMTG